jgi:hypothetical protein
MPRERPTKDRLRDEQLYATAPVPAQPTARFLPTLAVAVIGLIVPATPAFPAPASSLPELTALIAGQPGSVELVRTSRWKCVKRGRCWVPCRGDMCRKACFRTWWARAVAVVSTTRFPRTSVQSTESRPHPRYCG